ncbi:hypothetical protein DSM112329_04004 [Paraconexibacter sp. AEG42_29]|uniref:Apea-like HEPN domain-containing protein n=1 Tax=Paraconexibacter sp. AEG42_29 TaxID=2997339 RepID=A0AAU7AZR1_9ACTN
MRNRQLRAVLATFAEEAAWQLASDMADGHELAFEIVESASSRRQPTLYCYRPLTAAFIDERRSILSRLESYLPAVHALQACGGLDGYLQTHVAQGIPRDPRRCAELGLRAFLGRIFEDSTDFVLQSERFDRAYDELEEVVHEGVAETVLVCAVLGLELESGEVAMGDGLTLMRAEVLEDGPADAVRGDGARTLAVLRWDGNLWAGGAEAGGHDPGRLRLERLIAALRLFDEAGAALTPVGWTRAAGGPWQLVSLGAAAGGIVHGRCLITAAQEDELRAFCNLVGRRMPRSGELAWAVRRFELGCTRERDDDALSDHLMALRALLEPEGPQSGRLAGRLAALCAQPHERAAFTSRVAHIVALERTLIHGSTAPDAAMLTAVVDELSGHLRAVLRDVLCGHLDADLRGVADGLLAADLVEAPTQA